MIHGKMRDLEAVIELEILGAGNLSERDGCVIDTGFNGWLTLPSSLVNRLKLQFCGYRLGMLADGTVTRLHAYLGSVDWHGRRRDVLVSQGAETALIGMALLEGRRITMDVVVSGNVRVKELQSK